MGFETRGGRAYYYTAERVGGRVVKRYVGTGRLAALVARLEAEEREGKAAEAEERRRQLDDLAGLADLLAPLDDLAGEAAAAAMLAAGFHRHHRGPWRKRREQAGTTRPEGPAPRPDAAGPGG